ncbi:hypothetical protein ACS0TY_001336 [Phlomoides rotata]
MYSTNQILIFLSICISAFRFKKIFQLKSFKYLELVVSQPIVAFHCDKTRTPLENLEPVLREDIQKIWDAVPKPEAHKETPLNEFFNVEVVDL